MLLVTREHKNKDFVMLRKSLR